MSAASLPAATRQVGGPWRRVALRTVGIASADLLSQLPRIFLVVWPIGLPSAASLAFEIARHSLLLGAAVAVALEAAPRLIRHGTGEAGRLAIWVAVGLVAVAASVLLTRAGITQRLGLIVSQRSFLLHNLWNNAVVAAVAMVYLSRRRETRESEQRRRVDEDRLEQLRRELAATSVRSSKTRLDLQTLFACLHQARDLYPRDTNLGDELLDRLTRYLRLTLSLADGPRTHAQDAELATALHELERSP